MALRHALSSAGEADFPDLLVMTLATGAWRHPNPERVFGSIFEFITAPVAEGGLGTTVDEVRQRCKDHLAARDALDKELARRRGNPTGSNQYKARESTPPEVARPSGTTRDAGLRRLRAKTPELHRLVVDGKLTVNQAAIAAGFRRKHVTVPMETSTVERLDRLARARGVSRSEFINRVVQACIPTAEADPSWPYARPLPPSTGMSGRSTP